MLSPSPPRSPRSPRFKLSVSMMNHDVIGASFALKRHRQNPGVTGSTQFRGSSMTRVDLNCDMGESFGVYQIGADDEILPYVTSANIACGFHGGDPGVMRRTVRLAAEHGVAVGA